MKLHFGRIDFAGGDEANVATRKIVNSTQQVFREVVLCDADGKFWLAQDVPAGREGTEGSATAMSIDVVEASKTLRLMFQTQALTGTVMENNGNRYSYRSYGAVMDVIQETIGEARSAFNLYDVENGLFESQLRAMMAGGSGFPSNCFAGICDVDGDSLAIEGCTVKDSIHFVLGTLP